MNQIKNNESINSQISVKDASHLESESRLIIEKISKHEQTLTFASDVLRHWFAEYSQLTKQALECQSKCKELGYAVDWNVNPVSVHLNRIINTIEGKHVS